MRPDPVLFPMVRETELARLNVESAGFGKNQSCASAVSKYAQVNAHFVVAELLAERTRQHSTTRRSRKLADASQFTTGNRIASPLLDHMRVGMTNTEQNDMVRGCAQSVTCSYFAGIR